MVSREGCLGSAWNGGESKGRFIECCPPAGKRWEGAKKEPRLLYTT